MTAALVQSLACFARGSCTDAADRLVRLAPDSSAHVAQPTRRGPSDGAETARAAAWRGAERLGRGGHAAVGIQAPAAAPFLSSHPMSSRGTIGLADLARPRTAVLPRHAPEPRHRCA